MKAKIILIVIVTLMLNVLMKKEYDELERTSSIYLKQEDLPSEFGGETLNVINDFIQKTHDLDYEVVMYFDYVTGEIIDCAFGKSNSVKINFNEDDFIGKHIASIHNHTKDALSPPSDKNFTIFGRDLEDYELIVGFESFWILKAPIVDLLLLNELNIISNELSNTALEECSSRYRDEKIIGKMHNIRYANALLKYINDKNIDNIQLIKKEYCTMNNNSAVQFSCRKRPSSLEIKLARQRQEDPNILSGRDKMYALYQLLGIDIAYDEVFGDESDF